MSALWKYNQEYEMWFIEYLASPKKRPQGDITIVDNIKRLKAWIETSYKREWPEKFNVETCRAKAEKLRRELQRKVDLSGVYS